MRTSTTAVRRLTGLERKLLAHVANGATTLDVARRLELSETAVQAHLAHIAVASNAVDAPVQRSVYVAMRRGDLVFDVSRRQYLPQVWA
jgi:DNA-binding NarL/FixJ family response regulator